MYVNYRVKVRNLRFEILEEVFISFIFGERFFFSFRIYSIRINFIKVVLMLVGFKFILLFVKDFVFIGLMF